MLANIGRLCVRKSIKNVIMATDPRTISYCIICSNPLVLRSPQSTSQILQNPTNLQVHRHKSKGDKLRQKKELSDSESQEQKDDFLDKIQDKNTKTLRVDVTSMRLDALIKAGLGLSRNKIEVIFYESKIRLNGEKIFKKSAHINEGDEIDVIKGINIKNPDFLTIARIEVLSVTAKEESISVKLRRFKSLTIENYKEKDSWQP